jgi:hypothetical protein
MIFSIGIVRSGPMSYELVGNMLYDVKKDEVTARRKQLAWIQAILATNRWTPTRLAREAGISQSTLAKFLGDPLNAAHLSSRSVEQIAGVSPLAPYSTELPPGRGFGEADAQPFDATDSDDLVAKAVLAAKGGRNHVDPWVLRSRAIESAGYIPGDVLIVDLNATPADGDIVCAQVYDRAGNAETVFRLLERPFLAAATLERRHIRPLLIDDEQVVVRGVVVASVRPRFSRLAR